MFTIEMNNNYSKIVDHSLLTEEYKACFSAVYNTLSIFQKDAVKSEAYNKILPSGKRQWDGYYRFISMKNGSFLTGLLPTVVQVIKQHGLSYTIVNKCARTYTQKPIPVLELPNHPPLYEHQLESIQKGLNIPRGIFALATASGKTSLAVALAESYKLNTLFLVDNRELLNQAKEAFTKYGTRSVGIIGGGVFMPSDITIATIQTLYRRLRNFKHKYDVTNYLKSIDMFFADEAHKSPAKTWRDVILHMPNAYYRYGLSGTPIIPNDVRNMYLIGLTGPIIHKVGNKELIDKGISSKVDLNIIHYECAKHTSNLDYSSLYKEGIVNNKIRNDIIINLVCYYLEQTDKSILVTVRSIDHGVLLQRKLKIRGHEVQFACADRMNSQERDNAYNVFKNKQERAMIASMIYKEGIDIAAIDVLLFASGEKSVVTVLQILGRGLRIRPDKDKLTFYDFHDRGHYIFANHSRNRLKIYKKEEFEINHVEGDDLPFVVKEEYL